MLALDRQTYDAIVAHARRDHPDEACGIVAGRDGRPTRIIPMANAARSPTFYEFEAREQLRVFTDIEDAGEDLYVIYHSHTATEAYPSRTDVRIAGYPEAHYVVVSTRDPQAVEFRSFRINDGVVTEEPVRVEDGSVGAAVSA
ncbi:MAG: Mov34/MPN/PAD-1 family protein [Mycobacteriales bacterium]|nr:M67 family metallopeptidase [Frankia sp.]